MSGDVVICAWGTEGALVVFPRSGALGAVMGRYRHMVVFVEGVLDRICWRWWVLKVRIHSSGCVCFESGWKGGVLGIGVGWWLGEMLCMVGGSASGYGDIVFSYLLQWK